MFWSYWCMAKRISVWSDQANGKVSSFQFLARSELHALPQVVRNSLGCIYNPASFKNCQQHIQYPVISMSCNNIFYYSIEYVITGSTHVWKYNVASSLNDGPVVYPIRDHSYVAEYTYLFQFGSCFFLLCYVFCICHCVFGHCCVFC